MMGIEPVTRKEMFMAAAAGESVVAPTPVTREEYFLSKIVGSGGGGGGGVQADWNQNDPTAADYIKNRTHYDEQTVIEWDGDTTGKISVSNAFFRVSELTPTAANLLGGHLLWEREGFVTTDCIIDTEMAAQSGDVVIIGGGELGIVALSAGATIGKFTFAEPGVYVTQCDHFKMSYGNTYPIDRKYLPPDAILPSVTASDNGKVLKVVNGVWTAVAE